MMHCLLTRTPRRHAGKLLMAQPKSVPQTPPTSLHASIVADMSTRQSTLPITKTKPVPVLREKLTYSMAVESERIKGKRPPSAQPAHVLNSSLVAKAICINTAENRIGETHCCTVSRIMPNTMKKTRVIHQIMKTRATNSSP